MSEKKKTSRAPISSLEFRRKTADKVILSGKKPFDVAEEENINPSTLGTWVSYRKRELKKVGINKKNQRCFTYHLGTGTGKEKSHE